MLCGMALCAVNGYLQGRYLTNYAYYDISWFYDPRFLIGHLLFLVGMAINIYSDSLLRGLRRPGETGYQIPYGVCSNTSFHACLPKHNFFLVFTGGLFEYVSCANYFGEALEWTGYAIACWSVIGASFALWATLFLGSRALQHHKSVNITRCRVTPAHTVLPPSQVLPREVRRLPNKQKSFHSIHTVVSALHCSLQ